MSYPPWPDWTVEQWRAARVQSIAKYDPSQPRQPKGSAQGGEFASKAPVLQGVDSKANAKAQIEKHLAFHKDVTGKKPDPAKLKAAEEELRALPLIHGTTVAGAIGAIEQGLKSHVDMEGQAKELEADIKELESEIRRVGGWEGEEVTPYWEVGEVMDRLGITRESADTLLESIRELEDLRSVAKGQTFPEDKKLGLDRFVFMTHGKKHQDYGNVAVVIDNEILQDGWATEQDIVTTPGVSVHRPELGLRDAFYAGVENYQATIVKGDDYYAVAAARAGSPEAIANRSRDQLFEIKAPKVPKSAVKGFVVEDNMDVAQRLADKLASKGITGKVLLILEPSRDTDAFLNDQLKTMQSLGFWDKGALEEYREKHEGIYIL